jgi:fructose-specific phosphotransferase system IIC component
MAKNQELAVDRIIFVLLIPMYTHICWKQYKATNTWGLLSSIGSWIWGIIMLYIISLFIASLIYIVKKWLNSG